MLRVILDMCSGRATWTQRPSGDEGQGADLKGTTFKKQMDDRYRERSLVAHLRSGAALRHLD